MDMMDRCARCGWDAALSVCAFGTTGQDHPEVLCASCLAGRIEEARETGDAVFVKHDHVWRRFT